MNIRLLALALLASLHAITGYATQLETLINRSAP